MDKEKKIYGWDVGMGDYKQFPAEDTAPVRTNYGLKLLFRSFQDRVSAAFRLKLLFSAIIIAGIGIVIGLTLVFW